MKLGYRFVLSLVLAIPMVAQVTARQGTPADLKQGEFSSPLVLELPLDSLKVEQPGGLYAFTDQEKFVCDDVSIPIIVIKKSINWSKQVNINIKTTVFVRPSFDRKVTIKYSIVNAGTALNHHTEQEISAKENKYRSDSSSLVLSKEEFESLFNGEKGGKLKLVMTAVSDR